jgi:hypothetical protein
MPTNTRLSVDLSPDDYRALVRIAAGETMSDAVRRLIRAEARRYPENVKEQAHARHLAQAR